MRYDVGAGLALLLALAACGGSGGQLTAAGQAAPSPASPPPTAPSAWVDAVNHLCTAFDAQKTAIYEKALGDGDLTAAEYVEAEAAVAPLEDRFDRAVAALEVPADPAGQAAFAAYQRWVSERRVTLDAAAAGDEAAFTAALEASNQGFFESEQVRTLKQHKFALACLSR